MVWGPNPQFSPLDVNDTPNDVKMKLMSFVRVAFFSIPQIYGKGINHTNKILFIFYCRLEYTLQALLVPALYPLIVIRYGAKIPQRFHIKK
jgi:hypothetical protein